MLALALAPALALALAPAPPASALQAPPVRCAKIYVIVHRVEIDPPGRIVRISVEQVLDPGAWRTEEEVLANPVELAVPDIYLAEVRRFLDARPRQIAPSPYYTYTFYDPAQPGRADMATPASC